MSQPLAKRQRRPHLGTSARMRRNTSSPAAAFPTSLSTSILTSTPQTLQVSRPIPTTENRQTKTSQLKQQPPHHNHCCPKSVIQKKNLVFMTSSTKYREKSPKLALSL